MALAIIKGVNTKNVSREQLESSTHQNYLTAQSYYQQRRENLNNLFNKDMNNIADTIIQYIGKKAEEYNNIVSKKVYEYLDSVSGKGGVFIVGAKGQQAIQDESIELSLRNVLSALNTGNGKTGLNIGAALGNEFENFLERALFPEELQNAIGNVAYSAYSDVLSSFEKTGQITSKSFSVQGIKDIRPDIGLQMQTISNTDGIARLANATDINGENLKVELQEAFDINLFTQDDITSSDILKAYLDSNAYGFSLKVWESSNGKEFSQSSTIQNLINNSFLGKNYRKRTWESTYADAFTVFQISRLLINVIGPLNVAMVTGRGFTWMDDFISKRIFFMYVQMDAIKNKARSKRGPGYEGHPWISDSHIYIRQLTNDIHAVKYRHSIKNGRITVINRKIM